MIVIARVPPKTCAAVPRHVMVNKVIQIRFVQKNSFPTRCTIAKVCHRRHHQRTDLVSRERASSDERIRAHPTQCTWCKKRKKLSGNYTSTKL